MKLSKNLLEKIQNIKLPRVILGEDYHGLPLGKISIAKLNDLINLIERNARKAKTLLDYHKQLNTYKDLVRLHIGTLKNPNFGTKTGPTYLELNLLTSLRDPLILSSDVLEKIKPYYDNKWTPFRSLPKELLIPEIKEYLLDLLDSKDLKSLKVHPDLPYGDLANVMLKIKLIPKESGVKEVINLHPYDIEREGEFSTDSLPLFLKELIDLAKSKKLFIRNTPGTVSLNRFGRVNYTGEGMSPEQYKTLSGMETYESNVPFLLYKNDKIEVYPTSEILKTYLSKPKDWQKKWFKKLLKPEDVGKQTFEVWPTPQLVLEKLNTPSALSFLTLNEELLKYGEKLTPFEDGTYVKWSPEYNRFIMNNDQFYVLKNGGKLFKRI